LLNARAQSFLRSLELMPRVNRLATLPKGKAEFIEPMDCAPVTKLLDGPGWVWEILCGPPHKISQVHGVPSGSFDTDKHSIGSTKSAFRFGRDSSSIELRRMDRVTGAKILRWDTIYS
jgi:hypothetical protein